MNTQNIWKLTSKNNFGISWSKMTSFQDAPGLKLGFWSASKTLISFLGKLMLMKDQVRILSAKVLNLSTKLLLSGGIGTVKLGVNSVEKNERFTYLGTQSSKKFDVLHEHSNIPKM